MKAREGWSAGNCVPWQSLLREKSDIRKTFHPEFDRIARSLGIDFWVTREVVPAGQEFARAEVEAGLNRIYRLILRAKGGLSPALVERARLISDFEYVRLAQGAVVPLPQAQSVAPGSVAYGDDSRRLVGSHIAQLSGRGQKNIKVAILDTGLSLDHPELRGYVAKGADFVELDGMDTRDFIGDITGYDEIAEDDVGHGSHVGGIIGGRGLKMPPGIAAGCTLVPVRVLAAMKDGDRIVGAGVTDNINAGIKWAIDRGVDVINMSLGIKHSGGGLPHEEVIRYAALKGVTVVAASGNDGTAEKYYPGSLPGVIAVGAADSEGQVASFTSFGAPVWMMAPGTDILSAFARGGYAIASGTSQAAPFVSAAIALLKSQAMARGVQLGDSEVKAILRHTSDRIDRRLRTERSGYGVLNLADACRLLAHSFPDVRARRSSLSRLMPSTHP